MACVKRYRLSSTDCIGGDPDHITVGGQSAGAWYTVALLGHVDAHHLLNKALLTSFPGRIKPLTARSSQQLSAQLQDYLAPKTMATATTQEILDAQNQVMAHLPHHQSSRIPTSFIPIESAQLSKYLISQAVEVSGGNKDVIAWVTQNEMNAFKPHGHIPGELEKIRLRNLNNRQQHYYSNLKIKAVTFTFKSLTGEMTDLARRIVSIYHSYLETLNNGQMPRCLKAQKIKN
ncbi:carboxylesterase family protein [Staphylococcus delphini]|uniref:carboxylesterase family protein n=1 Tax=Staphylococcus delphini TaxID=53344 RepID=UPI0023B222B6|nr:carboxylesterase family protein [Staphylococcus delphini]MDE9753360.1 carboxylesterase family protein [Staphylococcus delphini]MDE9789949.1 carboxylesterase family protein [Staphylococcus delphini]MDE9792859.1 carboxylesterase family protein [Staphylococcus delphini]MDE9794452.1 carboxylesterase family protein [Staphylococcus delphini]MDE9796739.1 carboxylesterase family protein [Staphylococcus delphini]